MSETLNVKSCEEYRRIEKELEEELEESEKDKEKETQEQIIEQINWKEVQIELERINRKEMYTF